MNTLQRAYLVAKQRMLNGVDSFAAAEQAGQMFGLGYIEITRIWMRLYGG
jgi:hypothetical protein